MMCSSDLAEYRARMPHSSNELLVGLCHCQDAVQGAPLARSHRQQGVVPSLVGLVLNLLLVGIVIKK